jgi:hypothetical protein
MFADGMSNHVILISVLHVSTEEAVGSAYKAPISTLPAYFLSLKCKVIFKQKTSDESTMQV